MTLEYVDTIGKDNDGVLLDVDLTEFGDVEVLDSGPPRNSRRELKVENWSTGLQIVGKHYGGNK